MRGAGWRSIGLVNFEERGESSDLMTEEQEFQRRAGEAMDRLYRALSDAADDYPIEPEMDAGAIKIEFENSPAKFVVSPNAPARQIWVSAHSRSFKLDWDPVEMTFVHSETGLTLMELMEQQISRQLGKEFLL